MPCLDLIIIGGRIYQPELSDYEAIGVESGYIKFLGTIHDAMLLKCKKTRVIEANGGAIVPGFIDAHTHLIDDGFRSGWIDLSNVKSFKDLINALTEAKKTVKKGDWILGHSWDESKWKDEKRYPTAKELDEVSTEHPIFIRRIDGHMGVINTKAYEVLKIPKNLPILIYDNNGRFTGLVKEKALEYIDDRLKRDTRALIRGIKISVEKALKKGVTSIHEFVSPYLFNSLQKYFYSNWELYRTTVYFWFNYAETLMDLGFRTSFGDSFIKIGGIKLMMDGSIGARTAALREPYSDDPSNKGVLMHNIGEVLELLKKAEKVGLQLAIHAIGDRAIDTVLEVYKKSNKMNELRHRIEHFEIAREEHIVEAKRYNVILSMQPNFVANWQHPNGMYEKRLGKERVRLMNPFKEILDAGIHMAFGSDCMPFDPIYGMYGAVNHPFKEHAISVLEALKAYTFEAAYAEGGEDTKGSILEGKLADITILDKDISAIDKRELINLKVVYTILHGKSYKFS